MEISGRYFKFEIKKRKIMTTLPPPNTKKFPDNSLEKKVYTITESFAEFLPIANDRNRLGYNLFKYMTGEGDPPLTIVKNCKLTLNGLSEAELANKIKAELEKIRP